MQRKTLRLALLLALVGAPSVALADARTEARRHFRHGMELVVAGDVDAGVAELEEAYNILPHPNVLYNIGRAYAEVGRYDEARDFFDRYLESDPPDREEVRAIVAAIDQRLAARSATTAATATPGTPTETTATATPAGGGSASEEDVRQLRDAAAQMRSIAQLSGSETLIQRAAELERLATQLEQARLAAEAQAAADTTADTTATTTDVPVPTEDGAETTSVPSGTPELAVAASNETGTYEEQVISSSRYAQSPLDAASATTIVTAQDIRLTGITSFPELLRRVAGVHLMATSPADVNVGIRGFNRTIAARVVVLLNGRSTYLDALGTNFFPNMTIDVEDVERIEVIRGPASALYGANAFSGIVNIITRNPGDDPGTQVTIGGGNGDQFRAHASTNGRVDDFSYRLSAGYVQQDRWSMTLDPRRNVDFTYPVANPSLALQEAHARAHLRYRLGETARLDFEGGYSHAMQANLYANAGFTDTYSSGPVNYALGGLTTGWGTVRAFWNRQNYHITQADQHLPPMDILGNTVDLEGVFAHEFDLGVPNNIHLGVGYRWKSIDWDILDRRHTQNHYSVFFEDTIRASDLVRVTAGFRMDRHPLLDKPVWSPRGAVVLRPTEGQSIRISGTSSFRTMSFAESYVQFGLPTPAASSVGGVGLGSEIATNNPRIRAPALRPERIITAELGYLYQENEYFDAEVSLYYNRVYDLMGIGSDGGLFTLADYASPQLAQLARFDPNTNRFAGGTSLLSNPSDKYNVYGGELALRAYPVEGLDLYANYSVNYTFIIDSELGNDRDGRQPNHMVNAGVQYRSPIGIDVAADVHYYGNTLWPEVVFSASGLGLQNIPLDGYYLVNGRVGFRPPGMGDRLEFGIAAYNITNNRVKQYVFGQTMTTRVMASVTARF